MIKDETQVPTAKQFCLALIGPPLTRKSSIATAFPAPGVNDADLNLSRIKQWYPERKFKFMQPALNDDGTEVPASLRWKRFLTCTNELIKSPDVTTIIQDSMTVVSDWLVEYILEQPYTGKMHRFVVAGVTCMNPEQYRPYQDLLTRTICAVRFCGKPSIWVFHERQDYGDTVKIEGSKPNIVSSLRDTIQRLFTDVWRTKIKQVAIDTKHPKGIAYMVRTAPDPDMPALGTSADLPAEFEWDWSIISKAYPWLHTTAVPKP